MSIDIRLKHSSVNGKVPQPTDLSDGELALNTNAADPAIYLKDSAGAVRRVDAGAVPAGFRNQIINGDFRINQRSGTRTPGVGVYGFDRWKGHAGGLEQIVEALPAGQWTLSWSGGGNGTFGGTTAASPITATVAGGDTSVVVPSAATNVQLEPGPVATPFEHCPIGTELALCQRYYYDTGTLDEIIMVRGTGSPSNGPVYGNFRFPTTMRAAPSGSTVVAGWSANSGQSRVEVIDKETTTGCQISSENKNLVPGAVIWASGGSMQFDAEL